MFEIYAVSYTHLDVYKRQLMTRGVNGLYIYACDDQLREALKKAAEQE